MSNGLTIHLRDRNPAIADAWNRQFVGIPDVHVSCGPIFDVTADAVVSPANSYGFMDGGIDGGGVSDEDRRSRATPRSPPAWRGRARSR